MELPTGLEPVHSRSCNLLLSQLSYRSMWQKQVPPKREKDNLELSTGVEPATCRLQIGCSANWATRAYGGNKLRLWRVYYIIREAKNNNKQTMQKNVEIKFSCDSPKHSPQPRPNLSPRQPVSIINIRGIVQKTDLIAIWEILIQQSYFKFLLCFNFVFKNMNNFTSKSGKFPCNQDSSVAFYRVSFRAHQAEAIPHLHPGQYPLNPRFEFGTLGNLVEVNNAVSVFAWIFPLRPKLFCVIPVDNIPLFHMMLERC